MKKFTKFKYLKVKFLNIWKFKRIKIGKIPIEDLRNLREIPAQVLRRDKCSYLYIGITINTLISPLNLTKLSLHNKFLKDNLYLK